MKDVECQMLKLTMTPREGNEKVILCIQCRPADGMGGVICGLLLENRAQGAAC
jgi:hypothetical protein